MENKINCCLSEDMDLLAFGCKQMIKLSKNNIYEYDLDYILKELNLSNDRFIDMCILFGCDYIKPVLRSKPNEIYNFILNSKSIRNILSENSKNCDINEYINNHNKVKNLFKNKYKDSFSYICKYSINDKINIKQLVSFLKNLIEYNEKFINKYVISNLNNINSLIKNKCFR